MHSHRTRTLSAVASLTLAALALSGCSFSSAGTATTAATPAVLSIQGTMMGGSSSIVGANIMLWESDPNNTGYPSANNENARVLGGSVTGTGPAAVTTTSSGFSFTSATACDPGTFLYLTGTGGNAGAGTNNNIVEMSVLGPCSNYSSSYFNGVYGGAHVALNEATTVAAAYALNGFLYVDDTNVGAGLETVWVGAPANNAATTGSCSGAGSAMTCVAAGLPHAVQNAMTLVQSAEVGFEPSGFPANTVYGNPNSSIPVAMINTLASIMAYCVQTSGGAATSSTPTTNCGNVFYTSKSPACASYTCAPVDTLSMLQTIARFPNNGVSTMYGYVSAAPPFAPALSTVPQSLAISITYAITGVVNGSTQELFPQFLALDANDDVYVLSGDAGTTTQGYVNAISGTGIPLWNTALGASFCSPRFLATDTVGNVWATNNVSTTGCANGATYAIDGLSQASGSIQWSFGATTETVAAGQTSFAASPITGSSLPNGIAVDQYNNVWFDRGNTGTAAVFEIPYSSGATQGGTYATQVRQTANNLGVLGEIELDGNQNVWFSTVGSSTTSTPIGFYVLANQSVGTVFAPSYSPNSYYTFNAGLSVGYSFGFALDSTNTAWDGINTDFYKLAAPTNGAVINGNPTSSKSFASESKVYQSEFDGGGQLWYAYYSGTGEVYYFYNPNGTTPLNKGIVPCYAPNTAQTCNSSVVPVYDPRSLQIDSAGSVWIAGQGATGIGGYVSEIIGSAYPTWPQLSYAHFGAMPQ